MSWISEFEPQNVNSKDLSLPNELKKMSGYTKMIIKDLDAKEKIKSVFKTRNMSLGGASDRFYTKGTMNNTSPINDHEKSISDFMRNDSHFLPNIPMSNTTLVGSEIIPG